MAFRGCTAIENVYYAGTEEEWKNVKPLYSTDPIFSAEVMRYNSVPKIEAVSQKVDGGVKADYKLSCILRPAKVIIAGYKDGNLVKMIVTDKKEGSELLEGEFDEIKIMAWKGFGTIKPLADSALISERKQE